MSERDAAKLVRTKRWLEGEPWYAKARRLSWLPFSTQTATVQCLLAWEHDGHVVATVLTVGLN